MELISQPTAPSVTWRISFWLYSESKAMLPFSLAKSCVAAYVQIAYELVFVKADRANEVVRLNTFSAFPQLENHVTGFGAKKFIPGFLFLEFVLAMQLLAKRLERRTKLNIHYICGGQFACQAVQQSLGFFTIRFSAAFNKALDAIDRFSGFSGYPYRARRKAKSLLKLFEIHSLVPLAFCSAIQPIQPFTLSINRQERSQ